MIVHLSLKKFDKISIMCCNRIVQHCYSIHLQIFIYMLFKMNCYIIQLKI